MGDGTPGQPMDALIPVLGVLSMLTFVLGIFGLIFKKIRKPASALALASVPVFIACLLYPGPKDDKAARSSQADIGQSRKTPSVNREEGYAPLHKAAEV